MGAIAYAVSASGARSGSSTGSAVPRSPPQPPSPRTKIEDRVVHSSSPASEVATPSCQITAALPLSQTSVSVVRTVAEPDVGSGAWTVIACEPCTTWDRLMSQPGRSSGGGSVVWNVGTTTPNDGSTWRPAPSLVQRSASGFTLSPGREPAPMARW